MSASYWWVARTTSEAGAQGVPGAWLARVGFVASGVGVLALSGLARDSWSRLAVSLHAAFAVLMVAAAAFSVRSWEATGAYDATVDLLHSVAATAMGFAFAFGVLAVVWQVKRAGGGVRWLDVTALAASVALPLAMMGWEEFAGVLQRAMFVVAYLWYAVEAARLLRGPSRPDISLGVR